MPKIFLIKNRLHQQQLRLLEAQNLLNKDEDRLVPPESPPPNEPLSLVSRKRFGNRDDDQVRDIFQENSHRLCASPPSSSTSNQTKNHLHSFFKLNNNQRSHSPETEDLSNTDNPSSSSTASTALFKPRTHPPRRFISSILGGDIPYGSRGHVLTQAQRKEYPPELVAEHSKPERVEETIEEDENKLIVDEKPLVPEEKPLSLTTSKTPPPAESRPSPPPPPEPVVRCSVIQRAPNTADSPKEQEIRLPVASLAHLGPEQDQPIDYHVPKRKGTDIRGDEEEETAEKDRILREARRRSAILAARTVLSMRSHPRFGKLTGILEAAAGHGRSSNNNSTQGGANHQSGAGGNCGSGLNFNSGQLNSGNGTGPGLGGGSGAGGGMGGRDGRSNYGPNSPPTGSLPPFYESLKGGNNMNSFNANGSFLIPNSAGYLMGGTNLSGTNSNIDCDGSSPEMTTNLQNFIDIQGNANGNNLKYSMFNPAAYGIVLKDEPDIDYDSKIDMSSLSQNLLQNGYSGYDVNDSMMADIAAGGVDPLQITATLTMQSQADQLLDSLTDAVDLSSFLQNSNESSSPGQDFDLASSPDSVSITPVDQSCLENFRENLLQQMNQNGNCYDSRYLQNSKMYQESPPPSYQQSREMLHFQQQQHQQQQQQQQQQPQHHLHQQNQQNHHNSPNMSSHHHHHHLNHSGLNHSLSGNISGYHNHGSDNSNASLASPGSSSNGVALDTPPDAKPMIQSVSSVSLSPKSAAVLSSVLKEQRLLSNGNASSNGPNVIVTVSTTTSINGGNTTQVHPTSENKFQGLQRRLGIPPDMPLEFVNGGHGIKNPMAIENTHGHRIREDEKKHITVCEEDPMKFMCKICAKTFTLQRLLNRHMKCHSDIKRYLCTFCGKGFNDTFDLKRHTRTHTGVRPYKCNLCEKSFTQRCSLESHCLKVHGVAHQYAYKERRAKMYVCEECGHTTSEPEVHYLHLKENHPYSPALLKFYDKRHFKFTNSQFANNLLGQLPMPVHN